MSLAPGAIGKEGEFYAWNGMLNNQLAEKL
jgi:hypothetical protein